MLWNGGLYLAALEREKQLLFFVLAYVAADKTARLPALKTLLLTLRLPLLGKYNATQLLYCTGTASVLDPDLAGSGIIGSDPDPTSSNFQ